MISYRWRLVKMSTAIQNRMHSLLHRHNIQAPQGKVDTGENREWWEQLTLSELENLRLKQEIKTLRLIRENIVEVERELGRLSNSERWGDQAVHLMQLPGVGIIVTMTILSAIGDIRRFESPKKLVGYAGLGAGVHDSGQKHREKGITKFGRKELRWALVEASWQAVRSNPRRAISACPPKPSASGWASSASTSTPARARMPPRDWAWFPTPWPRRRRGRSAPPPWSARLMGLGAGVTATAPSSPRPPEGSRP